MQCIFMNANRIKCTYTHDLDTANALASRHATQCTLLTWAGVRRESHVRDSPSGNNHGKTTRECQYKITIANVSSQCSVELLQKVGKKINASRPRLMDRVIDEA
jgi:hypothetical protein